MIKITMKGRRAIKNLRVLAADRSAGRISPEAVLAGMGVDSQKHLTGLVLMGDREWHPVKQLRRRTCADIDKVLLERGWAYSPDGPAPPSFPCKNVLLSKHASRKGKAKVRKPKTLGELRCSSH